MVGFCCSAARFFAHFHHVVEIYFWIHKIGFSLFLSMLHYCWWLLFCFWWYCCVAAAAAIWPDFFALFTSLSFFLALQHHRALLLLSFCERMHFQFQSFFNWNVNWKYKSWANKNHIYTQTDDAIIIATSIVSEWLWNCGAIFSQLKLPTKSHFGHATAKERISFGMRFFYCSSHSPPQFLFTHSICDAVRFFALSLLLHRALRSLPVARFTISAVSGN